MAHLNALTRIASERLTTFSEIAEEAEAIQWRLGFEPAAKFVHGACTSSEILAAITTGNEIVRRKCLGLMIYFDQGDAANELVHVLIHDSCPVVRHEAAYYLSVLKRSETVPALIQALQNDPEDLVRHEAAEALGDMHAEAARFALATALSDSSDVVVRTAKIALSQLQ